MAFITFGNKELFEFVDPEKYLQRILSWEKTHTVRFEKPRWKCNRCGKRPRKPDKSLTVINTKKDADRQAEHMFEVLTYPECYCGGKYEETTRLEVGDIVDIYWKQRVPKDKKEWIAPLFNESFLIENYKHAASHNKWVEKNLSKLDSNYGLVFKPAHNLSDIIGKAVITDVYPMTFTKRDGEITCITSDKKAYAKLLSEGLVKFAKEDGFDSVEDFEGYFGSQLKEGESKTGTVYVYEKYKEEMNQ